ncbi:hypothetical protein [Bacillus thermotolerans]|uniref:Zn-ribbon containing protein n=1 Tax=Bacillus thermotolerans TaxID=1221996 RepID=A0A0F5IDA5_BACTR|nr:hypothetical protein [Bacillus thermotolerans]KKB36372.1 hypothetical protein QY97_00988 [Bacillus thermotolerans]KKB43147.1 hypothetical protein QY95_02133 [Bacillus thermotolerans]KKB43550.1 hypothetical protein QY96_00787 [Bacillus thermotolerans]
MIICPNCRSKEIGKIGSSQFYCWNCFIELSVSKNLISVHQVEEDGSLSSLNDLFEETDRQMDIAGNDS